jgi:hypothetical protein
LPASPQLPYLSGWPLDCHQAAQGTHFAVNAGQCGDIGDSTTRKLWTNDALDDSGANTTSRSVSPVNLQLDTAGLNTAPRLEKEFLIDPIASAVAITHNGNANAARGKYVERGVKSCVHPVPLCCMVSKGGEFRPNRHLVVSQWARHTTISRGCHSSYI